MGTPLHDTYPNNAKELRARKAKPAAVIAKKEEPTNERTSGEGTKASAKSKSK